MNTSLYTLLINQAQTIECSGNKLRAIMSGGSNLELSLEQELGQVYIRSRVNGLNHDFASLTLAETMEPSKRFKELIEAYNLMRRTWLNQK